MDKCTLTCMKAGIHDTPLQLRSDLAMLWSHRQNVDWGFLRGLNTHISYDTRNDATGVGIKGDQPWIQRELNASSLIMQMKPRSTLPSTSWRRCALMSPTSCLTSWLMTWCCLWRIPAPSAARWDKAPALFLCLLFNKCIHGRGEDHI